jgi:hypothetical protein
MTADPTPIPDEHAALIGRRWERNGTVRYYINDWHTLVGLDVEFYGTGNVRSATFQGEPVSNTKATRLLGGRLWIEDGAVYSTIDWEAARLNKPKLRTLVVEEIARRQAGAPRPGQELS